MAAPTITRETVEHDLTLVLRRLRRARELEDYDTADVYEAEIDRLIGWWQRIAQGKPRPDAGILSGQ